MIKSFIKVKTVYLQEYIQLLNSIIISNIYDTKKVSPIEGPPIVISSGDKSTVYIIGKIISVFKTA